MVAFTAADQPLLSQSFCLYVGLFSPVIAPPKMPPESLLEH